VKTGVQSYNYLEEYIDSVRAQGRYAFTLEELKDKLDVTDKAILQNLYRLKVKNKIVQIQRKFFRTLIHHLFQHFQFGKMLREKFL